MNIFIKKISLKYVETIQIKKDFKHLFVLDSKDDLKIFHCYIYRLNKNWNEFKIFLTILNLHTMEGK